MQTRRPDEAEVRRAAAEIVDAFEAGDAERYFAAFAPDATFVFHTEPRRLDDRAAYEAAWREWTDAGRRIIRCASSDQLVQTFPGGAVFSHDVATTTWTGRAEESTRERETIVFVVDGADGRLIAVHEHLSAAPQS